MKKQTLLMLGAATIIVAIGAGLAAAVVKDSKPVADNSESSPIQQVPSSPTEAPTGEKVTKVGIFGCLTAAQTDGPQTMECAFGIKLDDGTQYGLSSDDPMLIGTIPTGSRVEILGVLLPNNSNAKYDTKGTIAVESVRQL